MAFSTGNPQFDNLMRRARSRRMSADALAQNNIDVETIDESVENQENNDESDNNRESISDISGLGSTGIGSTGIGSTVSQSISDANEIGDIAGIGYGNPTAGQMAFDMEKQRGIDTFAKNDPIGAAITGYYSSTTQQALANLAPAALAYSGQIGAARALGQVTNVMGGPVGSLITGIIGPSMNDPYGNTVGMGSGVLGAVSNHVMSMHYSIADKAAQGIPGYAGGTYGGNALSVSPGFFGGLTFTGVNPPDVHVYSPTDFMNDLTAQKEYSEDVEPFGGVGPTGLGDRSTISVDTFDNVTQAGAAGVGYSSYDAFGNPTGSAPAGSSVSVTGSFSIDNVTDHTGIDMGNENTDNKGDNTGSDTSNDDYGGYSDDDFGGFKQGGKVPKKMAEGDAVTQNPEVVQGAGFIDQDRGATPQEEIKDDKPLEAEEGDFIINAPAAEFMGKQDVEEMISVAITNLQEKGVEIQFGNPEMNVKDNVQLLVSKNEVYIPKAIAEEIGYDKLEKINNRGKKEVSRRQQEACLLYTSPSPRD